MTIYVMRAGQLVPKAEAPPRGASPAIHRDLEGYLSPAGTGYIEGRAARREDLKRADCIDGRDLPRLRDRYSAAEHAERVREARELIANRRRGG